MSVWQQAALLLACTAHSGSPFQAWTSPVPKLSPHPPTQLRSAAETITAYATDDKVGGSGVRALHPTYAADTRERFRGGVTEPWVCVCARCQGTALPRPCAAASVQGVPARDAAGALRSRLVLHAPTNLRNVPDGMDIDAEGRLWVAHGESSSLACYDPQTGRSLHFWGLEGGGRGWI